MQEPGRSYRSAKWRVVVPVVILVTVLLQGCDSKSITAPSPNATSTVKLDVSYGAAPAAGWKWGVAEITTGAEEQRQDTNRHSFAWVFYVVRGSAEIGTAEGTKVVAAGEAAMVPAQQDHTHRVLPSSQILMFRPADRPFGDFHQGNRLWESEAPLALNAGQNYSLRVTEHSFAPGVANIAAVGNWGYVLEGTLTLRAGGTAITQNVGNVFGLASNQVLSNEGGARARFVVAGLF